MWFITQCFGVGFRGSHRAGDSVPLSGPPNPPDMAPDPHDEGDFEGPDTRSLLDEFMAKMTQSVASKAYAWRLLGMMPAISKTATVSQTDEWRANHRVRLYHSCIDILSTRINDLVGRDVYIRFADNMTRRSRVFLDFLCMDGDEVSTATMCPTTQCTTC